MARRAAKVTSEGKRPPGPAFRIVETTFDDAEDVRVWVRKTPEERHRAMDILLERYFRSKGYAHVPSADELRRTCSIVERTRR